MTRAVDAAYRAFEDGRWSRVTPGQRAAALWKLADLIEAHGDDLADLETLNVGKPRKLTHHSEIPFVVDNLRFGTVWVNDHLPQLSEFPHGGLKQSGFGKDMPLESVEEYTVTKHVMIDTTSESRHAWHGELMGPLA